MATHEHSLIGKAARSPAPQRKSTGVFKDLDAATICFAGDVADAIQLMGAQFTIASTSQGNYVSTQPDAPAEIRAPIGTLAGVAAFHVQFSKQPVHTLDGAFHTLVAMNPAALKSYVGDIEVGGIVIVDSDAFSPFECQKAGYAEDPLEDSTIKPYRLLSLPITQLNRDAVAKVKHSPRETERCRSYFALGLTFWLYDRPLDETLRWIRDTYDKNPVMIEAATRSLKAGYQQGETSGLIPTRYRVVKATMPAGRYRQITGTDALALGLLCAAESADLSLVFASYPVVPASGLLHRLCEWKQANVTVTQAEDDLAALNIVLGAAFGGSLGATVTSGPGLSLQSETLGLAVMCELPCVIIDVQRAGPSMGMPSKSEQADLLQALYGRHGDCPLIVLAQATPSDGFAIVLEAVRLAIRHMTPVIVLADATLAQSAETWRVPDLKDLPVIESQFALAHRPWIIPGTPAREHRISGLEHDGNGAVSFDPLNHEYMVRTRAAKNARAAETIAPLDIEGPASGELVVLGWCSTFGVTHAAAERCRRKGIAVANGHLRHLLPLPKNTGDVLKRYRRILVPELNAGQLAQVLRSKFAVEIVTLAKTQGRPFQVCEIENKIESLLKEKV